MGVVKIGITVDSKILKRLDELVQSKVFPSRSRAIHEALSEKLMRLEKKAIGIGVCKTRSRFRTVFGRRKLTCGA